MEMKRKKSDLECNISEYSSSSDENKSEEVLYISEISDDSGTQLQTCPQKASKSNQTKASKRKYESRLENKKLFPAFFNRRIIDKIREPLKEHNEKDSKNTSVAEPARVGSKIDRIRSTFAMHKQIENGLKLTKNASVPDNSNNLPNSNEKSSLILRKSEIVGSSDSDSNSCDNAIAQRNLDSPSIELVSSSNESEILPSNELELFVSKIDGDISNTCKKSKRTNLRYKKRRYLRSKTMPNNRDILSKCDRKSSLIFGKAEIVWSSDSDNSCHNLNLGSQLIDPLSSSNESEISPPDELELLIAEINSDISKTFEKSRRTNLRNKKGGHLEMFLKAMQLANCDRTFLSYDKKYGFCSGSIGKVIHITTSFGVRAATVEIENSLKQIRVLLDTKVGNLTIGSKVELFMKSSSYYDVLELDTYIQPNKILIIP